MNTLVAVIVKKLTFKKNPQTVKLLTNHGITENVINTLNEGKKTTLTAQQTLHKDKILQILKEDPSQILTILDQYPEAANYSEVMPFLIRVTADFQQRVLKIEVQVEKHEEAFKRWRCL